MAYRFADDVNRVARREFGGADNGGDVTYTPAGAASFAFDAIFDEATEFVQFDGDVQVLDTAPGLDVDLTYFAERSSTTKPRKNDRVELSDGRKFRVEHVEFDGRNGALLKLTEVS